MSNISTPSESEHLLNDIPADFRNNPGTGKDTWGSWLEDKLKDMPESERLKLEKLLNDEF